MDTSVDSGKTVEKPKGDTVPLTVTQTEQIIEEVRKYPHLYDSNHHVGAKAAPWATRFSWELIGKKLSLDPNVCAKKWKHLKNYHAVKKRKMQVLTPDSDKSKRARNRKWIYDDKMSFLNQLETMDVQESNREISNDDQKNQRPSTEIQQIFSPEESRSISENEVSSASQNNVSQHQQSSNEGDKDEEPIRKGSSLLPIIQPIHSSSPIQGSENSAPEIHDESPQKLVETSKHGQQRAQQGCKDKLVYPAATFSNIHYRGPSSDTVNFQNGAIANLKNGVASNHGNNSHQNYPYHFPNGYQGYYPPPPYAYNQQPVHYYQQYYNDQMMQQQPPQTPYPTHPTQSSEERMKSAFNLPQNYDPHQNGSQWGQNTMSRGQFPQPISLMDPNNNIKDEFFAHYIIATLKTLSEPNKALLKWKISQLIYLAENDESKIENSKTQK